MENQILLNHPDDTDYPWHHRMLLVDLGSGRWIWATPVYPVQVGDLVGSRVRALQRGSAVPRLDGAIYAFDAIPEQASTDSDQRCVF